MRFVAIVKESLPGEVENFARNAWGGEVLLDEKMAWYVALGGGRVNQYSVARFLAKLANPWSRLRANFKALKTSSSGGNLKGEGLITGGLYVVPRGGPPAAYAFLEEEVGDQFDPGLSDPVVAIGSLHGRPPEFPGLLLRHRLSREGERGQDGCETSVD